MIAMVSHTLTICLGLNSVSTEMQHLSSKIIIINYFHIFHYLFSYISLLTNFLHKVLQRQNNVYIVGEATHYDNG